MFTELDTSTWPIQDLKIYFSETVHSDLQDYRLIIRNEVSRTLKSLGFLPEDTLNLQAVPRHSKVSISISHCPAGSLFAIQTKSLPIGVDIESIRRIRRKVIERVSSPLEVEQCPNWRLLFTAKEAAWKANPNQQTAPTISHIETSYWKPLNENSYLYQAKEKRGVNKGQGFSIERNDFFASIYQWDGRN